VHGPQLLLQQFNALIVKRYIHSIRNKTLILSQLVVPIVILLINLVYLKYAPIKAEDSPALTITIGSYADNNVAYNLGDSTNKELIKMANLFSNHLQLNSNTKVFDASNTSSVTICSDRRDDINSFISCVGRENFNLIIDNYILAADFNLTADGKPSLLGYFNNQPFHVPPLVLNSLTNTLYNYYSDSTNKKITVTNHPLPRNINDKINDATTRDATG
jgi:ATP-binding cassette subfamily A (ABC1) protein 3